MSAQAPALITASIRCCCWLLLEPVCVCLQHPHRGRCHSCYCCCRCCCCCCWCCLFVVLGNVRPSDWQLVINSCNHQQAPPPPPPPAPQACSGTGKGSVAAVTVVGASVAVVAVVAVVGVFGFDRKASAKLKLSICLSTTACSRLAKQPTSSFNLRCSCARQVQSCNSSRQSTTRTTTLNAYSQLLHMFYAAFWLPTSRCRCHFALQQLGAGLASARPLSTRPGVNRRTQNALKTR